MNIDLELYQKSRFALPQLQKQELAYNFAVYYLMESQHLP